MNFWHLPGPSEYLGTVERSLRNGDNVILRFPLQVPTGLEEAFHVRMADCWLWGRVEVNRSTMSVLTDPLRQLIGKFAPNLVGYSDVTVVELCESDGFGGRLIWLKGLHESIWSSWMKFLQAYAQASRSVSRLQRTQFVAPLVANKADGCVRDIALMVHDWAGVVDEMDLAVLANDRLRRRGIGGTLRILLVMTIARVAVGDCDVVERLAQASVEDMVDPLEFLKTEGQNVQLERESSVFRPRRARPVIRRANAVQIANSNPDEIRRRVWSAQVSVLLPIIETHRLRIIHEHRNQIEMELQIGRGNEGAISTMDAEELEIGKLANLFSRPCFDRKVYFCVHDLRLARNALAHGRPLPTSQALELARDASDAPQRLW